MTQPSSHPIDHQPGRRAMIDSALPKGVVTPLVTFLAADGAVDREATAALVEHQIAGGVGGVLANGSTGELGNLTPAERLAVLRAVVEEVRGRVPVWSGVVGLGTSEAVIAARDAVAAGADALLVLPPLFFDAGDQELAAHFGAVSRAVDVPVLAYDVPPRTPRKLPVSLVADLAREGVLQGVKDSSGDLTAGRRTCEATAGVPGFRAYVGSELTLDLAAQIGFDGVVPGLANVLPRPAVDAHGAAANGDVTAALATQRILSRLAAILDVPQAGTGTPNRAINAIKVATALILDLPVPGAIAPFVAPSPQFVAGIAGIVDPLRTEVVAKEFR